MATLSTFIPPRRKLSFRGTIGADTSPFVDAQCGGVGYTSSNSFLIFLDNVFSGCNIATANIINAAPFGGGANFYFTRNLGYGVTARFSVEIYHDTYTDGTFTDRITDSSAVLTMSSTDLTSTTVAVPADTDVVGPPHVQKFYNVRLTKVECPWILP